MFIFRELVLGLLLLINWSLLEMFVQFIEAHEDPVVSHQVQNNGDDEGQIGCNESHGLATDCHTSCSEIATAQVHQHQNFKQN